MATLSRSLRRTNLHTLRVVHRTNNLSALNFRFYSHQGLQLSIGKRFFSNGNEDKTKPEEKSIDFEPKDEKLDEKPNEQSAEKVDQKISEAINDVDDSVVENKPIETVPTPPSQEKQSGNKESHAFKAETRQILDIVANSLYTEKEVFLRELISNASDALEKLRYLQNQNPEGVTDSKPLEIHVLLNDKENTITVQDSGIGMSREELIDHLGTIAKSGSKAYKELAKQEGKAAAENIIGQFGVGFYSSFMVGSKVEVFSKSVAVKENESGNYWVSDGTGAFEISTAENVTRGTKVVVYLKENCKEYAQKEVAEAVIRKYSNFVGFPIYLNGEKINTIGAIWSMDKSQINEEQFTAFYRFVANDHRSPYYRLQLNLEVPLEIKALLFFPERNMEIGIGGALEPGVNLYSRKVLIQPKSRVLLPEYLRFVKGVVDCPDIPLNISRENMQDASIVQRLRNTLHRRILKFLDEESKKDPKKYLKWINEFSRFLIEALHREYRQHTDDIARLLRFETSYSKEVTSLDEYISRMPPTQKAIYYLMAPNRDSGEHSPYYYAFKKKNIEVLFVSDHMLVTALDRIDEFNKRKLQNVSSSHLDDVKDDEKSSLSKDEKDSLISYIKTVLSERVDNVRVCDRAISSPLVIVDHKPASMKYFAKLFNHPYLPEKHRVEINIQHPLVMKLLELKQSDPTFASVICNQMLDNALISLDLVENPLPLLERMNQIMEKSLGITSTDKQTTDTTPPSDNNKTTSPHFDASSSSSSSASSSSSSASSSTSSTTNA